MLIDYYQGAYGPTIRFDTHLIEDMLKFREIISKLKNGTINEFSIRSIDGITITNMKDLIMKNELDKRFYYQRIKEIDKSSEGPTFLWKNTFDGWWHCEGLMDGLINDNSPGHQYLLEDDGYVIEFCYMES